MLLAPGYPERITAPVLAVAGGDDAIVDTCATVRLMARLPAGRVVVVPEAKHEILHERDPQREPFWRHFVEVLARDPGWRESARMR